MLHGSQTILNWCLLVTAAALLGHWVHRSSGFPRVLGYTVVGLAAGWLTSSMGWDDLPWPLQGGTALMLELAVGISLLLAASQVSMSWLRRQPWLLLQSLGESLLALALTTGVLLALDCGWAVSLAVGAVTMAASPAVLLRIAHDLKARGAVTDRSLLLATLSAMLSLLVVLSLSLMMKPDAEGGLVFSAAHLLDWAYSLLLSLVWGGVLTAALWPVLRWQSSRSDSAALYLLAALTAVSILAAKWGGSAALAYIAAGLLLRQLSPRPLLWPPAFQSANAMLNLLMFVLVASMVSQLTFSVALISIVASAVLARAVAKFTMILMLGHGTGIGWRRQWPVACTQLPLSGLALLMVSGLAVQWQGLDLASGQQVAEKLSAIALPMIVVCELLGVLLASTALWRCGDAHRGIGRAALKAGEKRHDT